MKRLLLLALFSPVMASGQKLEIGINGGFTLHSRPKDFNASTYQNIKNKVGYAAGFRASTSLKGWQLGLGIEVLQMRSTSTYVAQPGSSTSPSAELAHGFADPAITPHIFANRKLSLPKSYLYLGARAGYTSVTTTEDPPPILLTQSTLTTSAHENGFMVGMQLGYVVMATKHLGINAEVAPGYYHYSAPGTAGINPAPYKIIAYPVTVGIRYRII